MLFKKFGIGEYDEYWYTQEGEILQFKDSGEVKLEFKVVFIGSWSSRSETWMWSWANESILNDARQNSQRLKELYNRTGFDIFNSPVLECDEAMAHELTALAVEELQAMGMYISPDGKSHLFMAILEPTSSY